MGHLRGYVLVQRKKPDGLRRLGYSGGEWLASKFADFASGFQL
jgi:hypothetical protein